jgi:hypothetical protein
MLRQMTAADMNIISRTGIVSFDAIETETKSPTSKNDIVNMVFIFLCPFVQVHAGRVRRRAMISNNLFRATTT